VTLGAANSIRQRFAQCWRGMIHCTWRGLQGILATLAGWRNLTTLYWHPCRESGYVFALDLAALSTGLKDCSPIFGLFFPEPR